MESPPQPSRSAAETKNVDWMWLGSATCLVALGLYFRLRGFSEIVFLGDEYHGPRTAATRSFWECFTHQEIVHNSIPMTVYARYLLELGALNEWLMRIPAVLAGIGLLLSPLVLRQKLGKPTTLILLGLVAALPAIGYFTINARPYSAAMLCLFLAFVNWDRWMRLDQRASFVWFAVLAAVAVFFHVLCSLAVAGMFAISIFKAFGSHKRLGQLLLSLVIAAVVLGVLLGPSLEALLSLVQARRQAPRPTLYLLPQIWLILTGFLSGTSGLLLAAAVWGLVDWVRREPLFGWAGVVIILVQWQALQILNPAGVWMAWSRFWLLILPIVLVFVATGLACLVRTLVRGMRSKLFCATCGLVVIAALLFKVFTAGDADSYWLANTFPAWLLTSPLGWGTVLAIAVAAATPIQELCVRMIHPPSEVPVLDPERWTQKSIMVFGLLFTIGITFFSPVRWYERDVDSFRTHRLVQRPEVQRPHQFPNAYSRLAVDPLAGPVILECPTPQGTPHPAPYDSYQQIHGKRVIVVSPEVSGTWHPYWTFENTIGLSDTRAIAATGARYLVLHKDLVAECTAMNVGQRFRQRDSEDLVAQAEDAARYLRRHYGAPIAEDEMIEIYDLGAWE